MILILILRNGLQVAGSIHKEHLEIFQRNLGVAYAGAGEPYKAEDAFRRAAEAGVEEARHNLTQVQGVIEQL